MATAIIMIAYDQATLNYSLTGATGSRHRSPGSMARSFVNSQALLTEIDSLPTRRPWERVSQPTEQLRLK